MGGTLEAPSPCPQLLLLGLSWSTSRGGPLAFEPPPADSIPAPQRGPPPLGFGARDTVDLHRGVGDPKSPPPVTPSVPPPPGRRDPLSLCQPLQWAWGGGGDTPAPPCPPQGCGGCPAPSCRDMAGGGGVSPVPPSTRHYPPRAQGFRLPWAGEGGHTGGPPPGWGQCSHPPVSNCKYFPPPPPPINHSISLGLGRPPPLANPSRVGGVPAPRPRGNPFRFCFYFAPPPPLPPKYRVSDSNWMWGQLGARAGYTGRGRRGGQAGGGGEGRRGGGVRLDWSHLVGGEGGGSI